MNNPICFEDEKQEPRKHDLTMTMRIEIMEMMLIMGTDTILVVGDPLSLSHPLRRLASSCILMRGLSLFGRNAAQIRISFTS